MNERVLVSVIIPFYNRIKFTIRSVYSVLDQTHENVEIVLIDDCSTVNISVLLEVVNTNTNIKYYKNKINYGPSFSRNFGIDVATGDYICFLDSDDIFRPEKIKLQLYFMIRKNLNISYTSYIRSFNKNETIVKCNKIPMLYPLIAFYCTIATPTVMVKAEVFDLFRFNNKLRYGEDLILWINLSRHYKFHRLNLPLSIIYIGDNNHGLNLDVLKSIRQIVGKELYLHNKILFYLHKFYCIMRSIKF